MLNIFVILAIYTQVTVDIRKKLHLIQQNNRCKNPFHYFLNLFLFLDPYNLHFVHHWKTNIELKTMVVISVCDCKNKSGVV